MNLLFLGTFTSQKIKQWLNECGARQEPGDIVQKYIVKALCNNCDNGVYFLCSPRIEGYPKCKAKRVPNEKFRFENAQGLTVGYLNLSFLGLYFRKINFIKQCKLWAKNNKNKQVNIIVYSLNSSFLKGAKAIKRINPQAKICCIVPDLPNYMSSYKWPLSFIKKRDTKQIDKLRSIIDFYSLYTKPMAEELHLSRDKYIIIEGFVDKDKINLIKKPLVNGRKICIYAGDLHPVYGIQMLIDAFDCIDCNCELNLYGSETLAKGYKYNGNVKYMGMLSPDEVFQKMRECDLLINPRPSSLELTKYSFPSKTFEYMASGTPCIMCKLPGITNDYYPHLYFFDDETSSGFAKSISAILNQPGEKLIAKGYEAALFLFKNKTSEVQVNKIIKKFEEVK